MRFTTEPRESAESRPRPTLPLDAPDIRYSGAARGSVNRRRREDGKKKSYRRRSDRLHATGGLVAAAAVDIRASASSPSGGIVVIRLGRVVRENTTRNVITGT